MKKLIRLTAFCLVLILLATVIPFTSVGAVSIPSSLKSVVFNATYYANKYADLKAAFGTNESQLYNHFITCGIKEGRQASPMFSVDYYLTKNADLKAAFGSNRESAMHHFTSYCNAENRITAQHVDLGSNVNVRISMNSGGMNLGYSGSNVITVTPVLSADQSWNLARQKDGSYKITNNATGLVLDVYAASRASGANVGLYASNDTDAQRWFIYKNTNGTYVLRAKCGVTCALTVDGNSTSAGANVLMKTFNGAAGQQFKISEISDMESMTPANVGTNFWANIRGVGSNYNLALSSDTALIRYPNTGYNQIWRFIRFSDGSYEITNLKNGKSLDCDAGLGVAGTKVNTYTSNNTNAQRWFIYKVNGNYVLMPKCTTECALEVVGGGTASGTKLQLGKYSPTSTAQQFKIMKIDKVDAEKNLTISEICATPSNGAYEFMEIINTSGTTVNLNQYSLYRFGYANSGKYEASGYYTILGLESGTGANTDLKSLDKVNLSSYNVTVKPNDIVLLWFVSYADRSLTVADFKAYWTSQGINMTNVTVVPVKIYSGSADIYAATNINSGCGKGFLPDKKAGIALSLIKNEALKTRLENGKVLKDFTATADAPLAQSNTSELHKVSDSIALYFVSTDAEIGSSRNFYNYIDYEGFAHASTAAQQAPMRDYTHVFAALPYSAQVMGSNTTDGYPTRLGEYINLDSAGKVNVVLFGTDFGIQKTKPSPGSRTVAQFAGVEFTGTSVDSTGKVTFTGKFKYNQYSQVGFVITTISTKTGATIAKKTVSTTSFKSVDGGYTYSVTVSGLPVNDGSVVLNVVPYAVATSGTRVNGESNEIRCPLVHATINGDSIEGLKVTYLKNEVNAPINDVTGIKEAVELLANDIEYYTGIEVETGFYDPRASYPQIVIASSGSGSGGEALVPNNKTVGANQYSIINKTNGEIYIVGGNTIAAEYASQLIVKLLANATGTVEFTSVCSDTPKTLNTKNDHLDLTDGADYRFMSMNMLWYSSHPDESRYNKFIEFINYYSPDVIGLQECCKDNMNKFIPMLKAAGYTVIQQEVYTGSSSNNNTVPIAFKTSKFTCVEKGWKQLPGGSKFFGVTWAVLKDKTTSKKFAVTSSHFYNEGVLEDKVIIRQENTKMILSITNDIIKKHGCEVVNMGDFNMRSYDVSYHLMVDSGILDDSRFVSFRDGIMTRLAHSLGSSAPAEGSPTRTIDFFFTTSKVNVLRTRGIINMHSATSTDHFPLYCDVSFN